MTEEELATILAGRRFHPGMQRALVLVARGQSYRSAATHEGVSVRDLYRATRSISGLREAHLVAWRDELGAAMPAMWRSHLRVLDGEAA